jgi:hypothetical protein
MDKSRSGVSLSLDDFLAAVVGRPKPGEAAAIAATLLGKDDGLSAHAFAAAILDKGGSGGTPKSGVPLSVDELLAAILDRPTRADTAAFVATILGEDDRTGGAVSAAELLREFNPDEPRDWRGRWTTGGAETSGTSGASLADRLDTIQFGATPTSPSRRTSKQVPGGLPSDAVYKHMPDFPGSEPTDLNDLVDRRDSNASVVPVAQPAAPSSATSPTGAAEAPPNPDAQSEADYLKTLKDCIAGWTKDGYNIAAMFLQYFLDHKNGNPHDVCDASKLPFGSRAAIERDANVVGPVLAGLTSEAQAIAAKAGAAQASADISRNLGHVSTTPLDGEIFWAFGGFDLRVDGRLTVDGSTHRWSFSGDVTINDTYSFPATGVRTLFPSYAAANALQTKYQYAPFDTKLKWHADAEGSTTTGSPRVKYRPN